MNRVAVVDYGIGNILSVRRAFESQGAEIYLVSSPKEILEAQKLVLPGVGAFADGMRELHDRNLINAIQRYCECNRPFLGICLGMQMMLDTSEEFGYYEGLGIIPGKVERIDDTDIDGNFQKVPHVGWNQLSCIRNVNDTILNQVPEKAEMYFVHSYTAKPSDKQYCLADTFYGGKRLAAVIQKGNCYGTQFHPEKSGKMGLKIIHNFIQLKEND